MTQKSSEMPEPQVMNYAQHYEVTPLFINDLKKVLADVAYVDAQKFFKKIEDCGRIMPISAVNEMIRDLACLPFKYVSAFMAVMNNKDNFVKYFRPLPVPEPQRNKTDVENKDK